MRGDPPQYKKCGNRLHSTIATQGGHRYAAAETPVMPKIHVAEWKQNFTLGRRGLLRQWRRRHPCVRGGVVHLTTGKRRSPAVTPTSRPKPRGVSNAIDGGARHDHGLVRRGRRPAETRPARWNLVDARTTSDGGTDGQAYA